jgi:hypothetical protein
MRAACRMVVPFGTSICFPSMVTIGICYSFDRQDAKSAKR